MSRRRAWGIAVLLLMAVLAGSVAVAAPPKDAITKVTENGPVKATVKVSLVSTIRSTFTRSQRGTLRWCRDRLASKG